MLLGGKTYQKKKILEKSFVIWLKKILERGILLTRYIKMEIKEGVLYVGVDDRKIDLFEGQYEVPNGMAYNSYVILDEKIAVLDSVDGAFLEEWLGKIEDALQGKTPDYLIVQHMEPDHSANIAAFANKYPTVKIVASQKAFAMMKNYFGTDFADRQIVVGEGSELPLGKRTLTFVAAPMVHWPEVIITYDKGWL